MVSSWYVSAYTSIEYVSRRTDNVVVKVLLGHCHCYIHLNKISIMKDYSLVRHKWREMTDTVVD